MELSEAEQKKLQAKEAETWRWWMAGGARSQGCPSQGTEARSYQKCPNGELVDGDFMMKLNDTDTDAPKRGLLTVLNVIGDDGGSL